MKKKKRKYNRWLNDHQNEEKERESVWSITVAGIKISVGSCRAMRHARRVG